MLTEERKNKLLSLVQTMIQNKSYSGEEKDIVTALEKEFKNFGFDDVFVDDYGSIIASIKGNKPGKKILFDGHIDTVPVVNESDWTEKPFAGTIKDGKIYGRGASDMKGQTAAMIAAASYFAEDTKKDFAGEIYIAGVVFEEIFEGVAARLISKKVEPDYVVIGESSELNLKIGQRGRGEINIETFGKPAHSANPDKGINAVYKMADIILEVQKLEPVSHPELGLGILELTDIKSSPYPGASVVPDYCKVTCDRRLLVGETMESVLEPLETLLADMMKKDPTLNAKVSFAYASETCYTGNTIEGTRFFPGWLMDENHEYVQKAYKGLLKAGVPAEITQYSFATNGSHYAGEANIPTIGFGPSKENLAHTIDEYMEIEQIELGVKGYYGILEGVFDTE